MISLQNLGKHYGPKTLFEGVALQLNPGCRYGLVGANGSGKSTLMRILIGDEEPSYGVVAIPKNTRLGVLRQDRFLDDSQPILEAAMQGDAEVAAAQAEKDRLLHAGAADASRLAALEDTIARNDGYALPARAGAILAGLGIPPTVHQQPLSTLSGGFKLRVLLAQVLIGRPDVLLLDEPTNHLDILSIRWLEKWIAAFPGCAVVISHDARFLDNVVTHCLDIDYGTVTLYTGSWTRFAADKELRRAQKEAEIAGVQAEIEHKRAFVERFGAKATKATQAQSRKKQIEKLEDQLDDLPPSSRRAPHFRFLVKRPSGKDALEIKGLKKSFGDKGVLHDVTLSVKRGERVAVIGENGVGKSTLLKIIDGVLPADAGSLTLGHEAQLGYFAQDHKDILDNPDDTPLSWLSRKVRDEGIAYTRGQLGRALFSGDDVQKRVAALSGGEAARLVFAGLSVEQPNMLLLDEPTNHLDIESIQALAEALNAYEGTLLFVSHDRAFVSSVATRIIELRRDGMRDFAGSFAEYLASCGDDHLDGEAVAKKVRAEKAASLDDTDEAASSWEEQKRKRNRHAQLHKRRDQVLKDLEVHERRKAAIDGLWTTDGFFEKTAPPEVKRLQDEEGTLRQSIDALMGEWERIEAELAT